MKNNSQWDRQCLEALINTMAHVIVSEGLEDAGFIAARCEQSAYRQWREFISDPRCAPEATAAITGVDPRELRAAARLYAGARNGAIYYGLGVTEHSQGSTMVIYTTFHHPASGANVVTTENSDWATNCPEYKVTAVQLRKVNSPSVWQARYRSFSEQQLAFAEEPEKV